MTMIRKIEKAVNNSLMKFPFLKHVIKRTYQLFMYLISPKTKLEGDIERISPNDGKEYFFGYYDKSPWDANDRYMLCLRAENTCQSVAPNEPAEIILFDTQNENSYQVLGKTRSWNVQQGCMLQWLGPDFSSKIIYNDFRDGKYCSVILDLERNEEKVYNMPVYSVSLDGKSALTLDFSRLHRLRKGYGYGNIPEKTALEKCPDEACIWKLDIKKNEIYPILKYTDLANFEPRKEMNGAEHKVNHIMINPSGARFMVLHRWIQGNKRFSRLITADVNGENLFNLSDDNMVSHCFWKNDHEILAYERKFESGDGYYLMKDKTREYQKLWDFLPSDGHPSYSLDGKKVTTDTYPNRSRMSSLYVINNTTGQVSRVARLFAPFKYDNDFRCDLHPRWNRAGNKICFDAAFEGYRGLYVVRSEE